MTDPKIAQTGPYVVDEKPGKKFWCACGQSKSQPHCDGSHKGTSFTPMMVEIDVQKKVAWCGCKRSGNKPFCDGSHKKVP